MKVKCKSAWLLHFNYLTVLTWHVVLITHEAGLLLGQLGRYGQASGQGIKGFGGTWYVLNASGNPVTASSSASSTGGGGG